MSTAPLPLFDDSTTLRRLRDDEAPYPGHLQATDPPTVWVDLSLVPEPVWRCAPDGHVLAPVDVVRTRAGHAAVVPHCTDRLAVGVRTASPGQTVTIAVSMLRAAQEASREGIDAGSWWLDATGRPLLAAGGTRPWAPEAAELLGELAESATAAMRQALGDAAALIRRPRLPPEEVMDCEDALFSLAEPAPVGGWSGDAPRHSPVQSSVQSPVQSPVQPPASGARTLDLAPRRAETLRSDAPAAAVAESWIARVTDAEWAARVTAAARSLMAVPGTLRERLRARPRTRDGSEPATAPAEGAPRPRRALVWAVAATAAAAVIAAGLLWPESDTAAAPQGSQGSQVPQVFQGPQDAAEHAASPASVATTSAAPPATSAEDDRDGAARRLLGALAACAAAGAADCAVAMEDPAAGVPGGVVSAGHPQTETTLLDEYGGVAVFRVEAAGLPAQILVLVSADGEWLVRDVYDVADQP